MIAPRSTQALAFSTTLAAAWLFGCGGAAPPPSAHVTAPSATAVTSEPLRPTVPTDVWQLLPSDAIALGDVNLAALRQWRHFPMLRSWLTRYACVPGGALTSLLDGADRVVGASSGWAGRGRERVPGDWAVIARGTFAAADVEQALRSVDPSSTAQTHPHGTAFVGSNAMMTLLDERTLLVGSTAWANAALQRFERGEASSLRSTAFVAALSPHVVTDSAVITIMASPSAPIAEDVLHDLSRWGGSAAAIARQLAAEPYWGVKVDVAAGDGDVAVLGVAAGGTESTARTLLTATSEAFWQAGFFMRLIGLPPVLSNARLDHAEGVATVGIPMSSSDIAALLAKLEELIRSQAPQCTPTPTTPATP